jgi:hypothetical protein
VKAHALFIVVSERAVAVGGSETEPVMLVIITSMQNIENGLTNFARRSLGASAGSGIINMIAPDTEEVSDDREKHGPTLNSLCRLRCLHDKVG